MSDEIVPGYTATRRALHAVAEQVLAGALHRATGRIGLRATPDGFGTPWFSGRRLRVAGVDLVVEDGDAVRRAPLTTLGEAAAFAGIEPGAPDVYPPATEPAPDAPLALDPTAAAAVHDWFRVVADALAVWRDEVADRQPNEVQLWPEHFDLALVAGKVNYGGSPGDDGHAAPYAYVGPWRTDGLVGEYWNEPFGASRPAAEVDGPDDVLAFFRRAPLVSSE